MSKSTPKGLGRGFDTLIPTDFDSSLLVDENERVQKVFIKDIRANVDQPRKHFDETALQELAQSVKQYGVLQPLVVTPLEQGGFMIIAGERRYRAAQIAGLERLPVIVRSSKELEQLEIAIIENVQRVDLSPLEQAASIQRLHDQFNMGYQDIARRLGKAVTTVNNIVRLLQLPKNAIEALHQNKISEGHARAILALKNLPEKQEALLQHIQRQGWSVRQAEQFVQTAKAGIHDKKAVRAQLKTETPETKRLGKLIKAPVSIRRTAKGGKLEIGFTSDEELARLFRLLSRQ